MPELELPVREYLAGDALTHARTDGRTTPKHNASRSDNVQNALQELQKQLR